MRPQRISHLKEWFNRYSQNFLTEDQGQNNGIEIKREHSFYVCQEILDIGSFLGLSVEDLALCEAMALLHDIGRYEQFVQYHTFVDSKSINHARLGVKVIKDQQILSDFTPEDQRIICNAIAWHNVASLPTCDDPRLMFFSKLLRDADKIDIYRVASYLYTKPDWAGYISGDFDLSDLPLVSEQVCADLDAQKVVDTNHLKTVNDFKLLQIGWVYDINFKRTFQLIDQRGYFNRIIESLPTNDVLTQLLDKVVLYLKDKAWDGLEEGTSPKPAGIS